jgi:hypothetical protein
VGTDEDRKIVVGRLLVYKLLPGSFGTAVDSERASKRRPDF